AAARARSARARTRPRARPRAAGDRLAVAGWLTSLSGGELDEELGDLRREPRQRGMRRGAVGARAGPAPPPRGRGRPRGRWEHDPDDLDTAIEVPARLFAHGALGLPAATDLDREDRRHAGDPGILQIQGSTQPDGRISATDVLPGVATDAARQPSARRRCAR